MPLVEIPSRYRGPTEGRAKISVRGATVRACIEAVEAEYPGFGELVLDRKGELRIFVSMFLNGEKLARNALDLPVAEDDTISLLAAAAGG
jgi:molybdopterin synthase sulfur carrier subunit